MGFLKDRYNEYGKGMSVTLNTFVQTVKPKKLGGGAATVQYPHEKEEPGSSEKVKVIVAVCPAISADVLLVMVSVGASVS